MPGPIALKLRLLREERGLTQKEAAELADVSHWTLMYLESGKRVGRGGVASPTFSRSLQYLAFLARPSARTSPLRSSKKFPKEVLVNSSFE